MDDYFDYSFEHDQISYNKKIRKLSNLMSKSLIEKKEESHADLYIIEEEDGTAVISSSKASTRDL